MYLVRDMATRWSQHFHEHTQSMLGGGGYCTLLKNVYYGALYFHTGLLKIKKNSKYFLGGRHFILKCHNNRSNAAGKEAGREGRGGREGLQIEYSVYAFDNVDNSGQPFSIWQT